MLNFEINFMKKVIINRLKTIEQNFQIEEYFTLIENAAKLIINALKNKKKIN